MTGTIRLRFAIVLLVGLLLSPTSAVGEGAARSERYRPPVDAPIAERFRLPEHDWLPGNRGLKYDTRAGDTVRAIGPGTVTFAGQVGGTLHVTITHRDGLRSSYSYVAAIRVQEGDRLRTGDPVAVSGDGFHLGVRRGDRYLDPETILGSLIDPGRIRLVPVDESPRSRSATPPSTTPAFSVPNLLTGGLQRVHAVIAGHWGTARTRG